MNTDAFSSRIKAWAALWAVAVLLGCATPPAPPKDDQIAVPTPEVVVPKPKRLGLALGGGGARGFAHVGVLQVLEEAGIKPDLVVGTSAGSLVGALHASGKSGAQLQRIAETMEESTITDWALPFLNRGVLRGEALARYVSAQTQGRKIEELPIRLGIVATDLNLGEGVLFQRGDTATAVRASSAVPSVFLPVRINNRDYVDGGLVAPVPVRYARDMGAEVVLAVDISTTPEGSQAESMLQILLQTFNIMGKSIKALELKEAQVVVRPNLAGVSSADFNARLRAIEAGRAAMWAALPALKAALNTTR
ncbi:MAG: patatin-like phospholipase family protein [Betaproteobacteria bacterium]|nr:patatin-like phospholipase family protein [Betaproteobacteria bacterium]